ncbi:MAG: hypothetical protein ABI806_05490 [Candidatus Solibacter sp.]
MTETGKDPDAERRYETKALLSLATEAIASDNSVILRATELAGAGYGAFDALHLSFAEAGQADVLLTTDDRFIKRAARAIGSPRVRSYGNALTEYNPQMEAGEFEYPQMEREMYGEGEFEGCVRCKQSMGLPRRLGTGADNHPRGVAAHERLGNIPQRFQPYKRKVSLEMEVV